MAARHYGICKIDLAVEFKRARLDRKGPRGGARIGPLVDDAHLHSELGQPEREHELTQTAPAVDADLAALELVGRAVIPQLRTLP